MEQHPPFPSGEGPAKASARPDVTNIDPTGDVILDVTFDTSRNTVRQAQKTARAARLPVPANIKHRTRFAYRVKISLMKKQSKYFESLLGNTQFHEARVVKEALSVLSAAQVKPADACPDDLPWIQIQDDDDATQTAGRDAVFSDLLRILHGQDIATKPITMTFVTTLAILADRFTCTAVISRCLATRLKFKWPATHKGPRADDSTGLTESAEGLLRQKILAAWLLDQPPRLQAATRDLIMFGSRQWSFVSEVLSEDKPSWWDLPDDLENELRHRREAVMNTISSVLRHFLSLYTSRGARQCKLGYDSSASCDSYQLGEMVRFFAHKNLLHLTDFGPASVYDIPDHCQMDMEEVIATLRQFPGYQVDPHHTNCGLRIRILPILEYIQTMLASGAIAISSTAWKTNRAATTWISPGDGTQECSESKSDKVFRFTRSISSDQRLRYEGAMAAEKLAKALFTANEWDWTPEDDIFSHTSFPGEFRPLGFNRDRTRR